MTRICDLHTEWMKDPAYQAEYEALEPETDTAKIDGPRGSVSKAAGRGPVSICDICDICGQTLLG